MKRNLLLTLKQSNTNIGNSGSVRAKLAGKTVEIIGVEGINGQANGNPHSLPIGRKIKLSAGFQYNVNAANIDYSSIADTSNGVPSYIFLWNLRLIANSTVNDFNAELEEIDKEEKLLKEKKARTKEILKFMGENEISDFDEDVFKVYQVVKKCKSAGSDIEKAIEIAKLLKD